MKIVGTEYSLKERPQALLKARKSTVTSSACFEDKLFCCRHSTTITESIITCFNVIMCYVDINVYKYIKKILLF